jgi:hypothetical protein
MSKVCHDVAAQGTNYFDHSAAYCSQLAERAPAKAGKSRHLTQAAGRLPIPASRNQCRQTIVRAAPADH